MESGSSRRAAIQASTATSAEGLKDTHQPARSRSVSLSCSAACVEQPESAPPHDDDAKAVKDFEPEPPAPPDQDRACRGRARLDRFRIERTDGSRAVSPACYLHQPNKSQGQGRHLHPVITKRGQIDEPKPASWCSLRMHETNSDNLRS